MTIKPTLAESKLNVLLTDSSPNWGGQQYRLLREAVWLDARGHRVLVLCGKRSELACRLEKNAPHIAVETVQSWGGPFGLLEFLWKIRRARPDIIHARSGQDALWASLLHFTGWLVVRSRHMTVSSEMPPRQMFTYRSGCVRIIAAAEFIKRDLCRFLHIPEDRVDVAGEGIDLKEFHPGVSGVKIRQEFSIPEDAPVFGLVAMIRSEKGHKHFVNAAIRVLRKVPAARFLIVGDGQKKQVDKLRLKIRKEFPRAPSPIIFAGYREDVTEVMAAIDVLVVPSMQEAQSIVIPQAFATGKPVIASNVGGIPEIVRHGVNGLLVNAGDVDALAEAMGLLCESPQERRRLGAAGLEFARAHLSFDQKMELVLASYRKALGR